MASLTATATHLGPISELPEPGTGRRLFASGRLTGSELLWVAFVVVQALDGVMSYIGVHRHGPGIEANPLVAWYLGVLGPGLGFMAAKLFAVTCGAVLYMTARHHWVAVLTLIYLVFAVGPWLHLLAGS